MSSVNLNQVQNTASISKLNSEPRDFRNILDGLHTLGYTTNNIHDIRDLRHTSPDFKNLLRKFQASYNRAFPKDRRLDIDGIPGMETNTAIMKVLSIYNKCNKGQCSSEEIRALRRFPVINNPDFVKPDVIKNESNDSFFPRPGNRSPRKLGF